MNTRSKTYLWYSYRIVVIAAVFMIAVSTHKATAQLQDLPRTIRSSAGEIIIPQAFTLASNVKDVAYTYQQSTGNRLIQGQGHLPLSRPVDIVLADEPRWLVALPVGEASVWVTVLADGRIQAFWLTNGVVTPVTSEFPQYPSPIPPVLELHDGGVHFITSPSVKGSLLTHPVRLTSHDHMLAFIENAGDLVIWDDHEVARLPLHVLKDCRPLTDEAGRILVLTDPSTHYTHGILGDTVEATGIALLEIFPAPRVLTEIQIPHPRIIEGLAPIWADLNGDGQREILVTISDAEDGAQLIAYSESGEHLASGLPVGRGYRWRHQLAVASFGPNGETEIASVLTPHIGGIVEFSRLIENRLEVVAQVPGYSTHVIGSRNLDTAVAGDFDADDKIELLVPNQAFDTLGAIRRTTDGAQIAWTVSVGGKISTNLAAVQLVDGTIVLGVGHEGRMLRLWGP